MTTSNPLPKNQQIDQNFSAAIQVELGLARVWLRKGGYQQAIRRFEKALTLDPELEAPQIDLAKIHALIESAGWEAAGAAYDLKRLKSKGIELGAEIPNDRQDYQTDQLMIEGQQIADSLKTIPVSKIYLPRDRGAFLPQKAHERFARYGLDLTSKQLQAGETSAALLNIRESLKANHSDRVVLEPLEILER